MARIKEAAQKHWPTALIVTILLSMTAYLSSNKLSAYDKADQDCYVRTLQNEKEISSVCRRVDKIETTMPFTTEALKKNTTTIENMAKDVQEIKVLILSNIKDKGHRTGYDRP